jgi:endonuclease/exonuclease/phosphatase family metal-dependent hydrolase
MKKQLLILLIGIGTGTMAVFGQTFDVLTYNIRYDYPGDSLNNWGNRKEFLISQLNFYQPAIVGTQEGLLHQLKDMEKGLEGYAYFGKGRDDGLEAGEFSAIFYDRERVELLKNNTFWLSETSDTPSKGWDAAIKRVCTYGLFKDIESEKVFWVFNTHFDHVGEQARKESILLILKKIEEINTGNFPVILMGDLNLEPDHPSIQFLAGKMEDTKTLAGEQAFGPEGTFNGFKFSEPVTRRIDYIFCSPEDFKLLKYAVLSDSRDCRYPSDHLPVYVRLKLEEL